MPGPDPRVQEFWADVYTVFNPLEPVSDPALRVSRSPKYSPAEQIIPKLLGPFPNRRFLIAGGIGSGKSTELIAISERVSEQRVVVLLDLWRHLEVSLRDPGAFEHLQPWEIVALVGLGVLRAGTERFGHAWGKVGEEFAAALAQLRASTSPERTLDVARLSTGLAVAVGGALAGPAGGALTTAGLKTLEAIGSAWSWKIGQRDAPKKSEQDEGVGRLVAATAALLEGLSSSLERRMLVVLDGLDRVRTRERFRELFVDSSLMERLPCDLVVSAHLALVHLYGTHLRFDKRYDLCNEPVADKADPWTHGTGIAFFRRLVALRLEAVARRGTWVPGGAFSEEVIDHIAWCSGGRLRDFIGFIRDIAELCYASPRRLDLTLAAEVIEEARRNRSGGIDADQIAVLQGVIADPHRRLPGGEVAISLLEQQLLLAFPNEDTWYLPHPLLMLTLIERGSRGSGASSA